MIELLAHGASSQGATCAAEVHELLATALPQLLLITLATIYGHFPTHTSAPLIDAKQRRLPYLDWANPCSLALIVLPHKRPPSFNDRITLSVWRSGRCS